MPIFEVEHNGQSYEVDAPDMQAAAGAFSSPQAAGGADTAADSAARGLPPNPAAQPVAHTGYRAQVNRTMSGNGPQPRPAPNPNDMGTQWKDAIGGAAVGIPSGVFGTPGDVEGIARFVASKMSNVSPKAPGSFPYTSSDLGNMMAGQPSSPEAAGGRIVGNLLSPSAAMKGASLIGKVAGPAIGSVAAHSLGATTGAGGAAIKEAFQAGRQGGSAADAFTAQMRGGAPMSDVVQTAKDAVEQLRLERSKAYKAGIDATLGGGKPAPYVAPAVGDLEGQHAQLMSDIHSGALQDFRKANPQPGSDPAILNFAPIDKAIRDVSGVGMYQGKSLSAGADKVWNKIENVVDDWRQSDPNVFHTPEGLDALKKKIGNLVHEEDLKDVAKPGSPGSVIVNNVYNAIKRQITDQAPGYAKVMKDYSEATDELRNIEQTLSLKPNANVDTSLRKLQSIMRNNANANYGQRVELGNTLNDKSGGTLMPQLAGQALSSPVARGIQGPLSGAGGLTALFTNPQFLPMLAATSPRLVGESAHAAGKLFGNAAQKAIIGSGNAGVGAGSLVNPKILGMMSPQILAQLLLQTQSPTH